MNGKTRTDTALTIAIFGLLLAFIPTLYWVTREAPNLRLAHWLLYFLAMYAVVIVKEVRAERRLDEVELAAVRFGARWGLLAGFAIMGFVSVLPPVHAVLADIAAAFGRIEDRSMTGESRLFLFGGITLFLLQEVLRSILAAAWKRSKQ